MTQELNTFDKQEPPEPKGPKMALIWGVMLALLAGNVFAVWKTADVQSKAAARAESLESQIENLKAASQDLTVRADTHEVSLRSGLEETRDAVESAALKAAKAAEIRSKQAIDKLAAEYRLKQSEVAEAIGEVGRTVEANSQDVAAVRDSVTDVAGNVQDTRTQLGLTDESLQSVKGDLGVQSGLIATNAKELMELRKLGERDYHEFSIPKDDEAVRVGNVAIQLRKTNVDKSRFTINVIADDLVVPKKDRTVNEPIQFYVSGSRAPYEIVVNEIDQDRIVGYLSVPKVLRAAAR